MDEHERTTPKSKGCWPRASDVAFFQIGYKLGLITQKLDQLIAMQTAPPTKTKFGQMILTNISAWSKRIELAHKLYLWSRLVLWPAYIGFLRWLGLLP